MKLNQRLLIHIGIGQSPYGTPTEVTVMEFSPCENFVKLNPAIGPNPFWVRVKMVHVLAELGSNPIDRKTISTEYGPKHSTFQKEETRQSMADAVRLAKTFRPLQPGDTLSATKEFTYTKP